MKKISTLLSIAFTAILISSCGIPSERIVNVSNVEVSGLIKEYIKVVDGEYKFINNGDEASLTVKFELIKKPTEGICDKEIGAFIFRQLKINAIGKDGSIFDTGFYGFEASSSEIDKLSELLKEGKIGSQKSILFKWQYFGQDKDQGKLIFKNAESFEVNEAAFSLCSEISDVQSDNSTTEPDNSTSVSNDNSSSDCDQFIKNYEAFANSYIKILKKYKANPSDMTILNEYTELTQKATEMQGEANNCTDTKYMTKLSSIAMKIAKAGM